MPVKIHGKEYKTVAERVNEAHADHENNIEIQTELVSWEDGVVIMKANVVIYNGDIVRHFVDYAYEKEDSSPITETSVLEVCSTSAIGRALAAAGYAGTEYASANEVENAIHQQTSSIHQQDKAKFDRDAKLGFGKNENKTWREVDAGFLLWVTNNMNNDIYVSFANAELDARNMESV